jgi:hypothetical protein
MATKATKLHTFSRPSPVEQRPERGTDRRRITGNIEVRPLQMLVWPWRLPSVIEVEPEVRGFDSCVGTGNVEGHRSDPRTVRQGHG